VAVSICRAPSVERPLYEGAPTLVEVKVPLPGCLATPLTGLSLVRTLPDFIDRRMMGLFVPHAVVADAMG
jgi:hypothetical protein